jgi:diaminopimelate epimerase
MELLLIEGAGNRFAVVDGIGGRVPADPAGLAQDLFEHPPLPGFRPDGLLMMLPDLEADVRMAVYNADGSRPAACGNGLRCVAQAAVDQGYARPGRFAVATDAGLRAVEVDVDGVRTSLGAARHLGTQVVGVEGQPLSGTAVDLGNPHFVLCRDQWRDEEVARIGAGLQTHPNFPGGVNVGFAMRIEGGLELRVFERGVGETLACGTGACAAAVALTDLSEPVLVHARGGLLQVERAGNGDLWLAGPVRGIGRIESSAPSAA